MCESILIGQIKLSQTRQILKPSKHKLKVYFWNLSPKAEIWFETKDIFHLLTCHRAKRLEI